MPSPYGGKVLQVQVDLNQDKLQAYGLSSQDVVEAIARQNLITPVGTEKVGSFEYIVNLNNSPKQISELNDLPIREVNGAPVYIHDVAYVHAGAPPQTNMVRVDGSNAVLMTILKSGSASTLDVIAGIKALLPKLRETLPAGVHLQAVGDQSTFVKSAVSSVIFEGVTAAVLTGLMILVFLGSWRSTLIIMVSIPLAILTSVILLSVTGETINVMTLGGLALAVGILVDDATVTIENINYHLELGKDIESAIMDGARQIVIPATVSLLCICIVFVPMFNLGGVAGYLFRPMAKAVVFALLGSYVLSRTLVNTMARFLLAHQAVHGHGAPQPPTRNPLKLFQRGFERRFEAPRAFYRRLLLTALGARRLFIAGFMVAVFASFALTPYLGRNFFPPIESTQIALHVRAPTGTRIEETAMEVDRIEQEIRSIIPPKALRTIVDNIGLPISGINMAYSNTGHDRRVGRRHPHLAHGRPRSRCAGLRQGDARDAAAKVSRNGLRVSARRHRDADSQLRPPGADRRASRRSGPRGQPRLCRQASRQDQAGDRRRRRAHPAGVQRADASMSTSIGPAPNWSGSASATSRRTFRTRWPAASSRRPPSGSIRRTASPIRSSPRPRSTGRTRCPRSRTFPPRLVRTSRFIGGVASIKRGVSDAVVSHYAVQPVVDIFATNNERDLGAVSADIQKILDDTQKDVPRGSSVVIRGATQTMTYAYSQLFIGIALAVVLIYLLIVVNFQSWMDPFVIVTALPAALAGIVWMLFITRTTLSVPALTGAIMCMGVATANSILVVSFARERMAEGADALTAAVDAGFTRFRPVLMTALAMIIGMMPMALSAELNAPLGRAVIGGLIFATVATLLFVPAVFRLVHERRPSRAD